MYFWELDEALNLNIMCDSLDMINVKIGCGLENLYISQICGYNIIKFANVQTRSIKCRGRKSEQKKGCIPSQCEV